MIGAPIPLKRQRPAVTPATEHASKRVLTSEGWTEEVPTEVKNEVLCPSPASRPGLVALHTLPSTEADISAAVQWVTIPSAGTEVGLSSSSAAWFERYFDRLRLPTDRERTWAVSRESVGWSLSNSASASSEGDAAAPAALPEQLLVPVVSEAVDYRRDERSSTMRGADGTLWTITAELGAGVRGLTCMVRNDEGDECVCKVQNWDARSDGEILAMALSRGCPGVIQAVSVWKSMRATDGSVHLLMDKAPGVTLQKLVGSVSQEQAALILRGMLKSLAALHARAVLHMDLQPENMFWDEHAQTVTLIDLGSAHALGVSGTYVGPSRGGSWWLMPLEQFPPWVFGSTPSTEVCMDFSSDVFSAISCLLHLRMGRAPFREYPSDFPKPPRKFNAKSAATHPNRAPEQMYELLRSAFGDELAAKLLPQMSQDMSKRRSASDLLKLLLE
jgi:serine/threonine protein kinase